ncbi:TIGR02444 family protein [Phenylobacterium sp.]|uniref:TIGR02444 family protein n=1 Tax=Phenylobacterium sp. TaxID=1871053 RepID=UPI0035AD9081
MSIWEWALEVYARPGAPEACLALQDEHGQNTSLLLWAVWAETTDSDLLARAATAARAWDETALKPLRAVRRALKAPAPPIEDAAREGLREDVKAAELRAERVLLETLQAMSPHRKGGAPALAALEAATAAWGRPAPAQALAALAEALH